MKSFRTLFALAALTLLPALALADTPATKQWILATAKASGAGGEHYVSSLRIVNPGTVVANVKIFFFAQSAFDGTYTVPDGSSTPPSVDVQVAAGQMLPIEDVLGTKFPGAAAGGLRIESDQPVSVLSRTYVENGKSSTGKDGTFGFSIPAQVEEQLIGSGDTGYIPYIASAPDRNQGFRCNFIMLNTVDAATIVNVALKKADGTLIGQRDYTLGKFSTTQHGDIANSFGYPFGGQQDQNLFLVATVKSGGPVAIGTSIVDNAISSLNYAPPTKLPGSIRDGVYGIVFKSSQDGYGMTARVDIFGGSVQYMAFSAYPAISGFPEACPSVFWLQVFPNPGGNTTFTKNLDGSTTFTGSTSTSTWSGTISPTPTGITGNLIFGRTTSASTCPGASILYDFTGTWASPYNY